MPNLENLKKQAKLYVRWHRDRYYPVAAQVRAVLPRYRDLTDRQVLAAEFKLSDAQDGSMRLAARCSASSVDFPNVSAAIDAAARCAANALPRR